jgi:hypothetical protein
MLSWVTQRGELVKVFKTIRSCPFKSLKQLREGWSRDDFDHVDLSPLDQLWELFLKGPHVNLGLIQL